MATRRASLAVSSAAYGVQKKGGKKFHTAHLREENSFQFDEALGRWVCKDANGKIVEEEAEKPVAPPTISEEMKAKWRNVGMGEAAAAGHSGSEIRTQSSTE